MAIVKSVFALLVFATTASRIFGQVQVPLNSTSNMVYNIVGNSTHSNDFYQYRRVNTARNTFSNRTLSQIPSGVCIKEVPTASLVADPRNGIPIGNGSTPEMSRIHVCCEGFERHPYIFRKCSPICSQECINGICVAPNRCQCNPNHVQNLAGYCVATCPIGCHNGECDSNVCKCKLGYQLEPNRKFCIPKCSQGCLHGNCTEPEVCSCNAGYQLRQGRCTPICEGGCDNGECVAPGQCSCTAGYQKSNDRCEPICTRGCNNGLCVRPNVCECRAGWSLDETGLNCVPGCSRPCLNGLCTAADTCTCNKGYVLDPVDPFKCIAFCPNGCPNGICSAPNWCLCNLGFVKDRTVKGSQNCIPRQ